jgi:hypothetical protein
MQNLMQCADENYLDFYSIQHCTNGLEGNVHLAANAARTTNHDPQIPSFPAIEFNGVCDF